MGLKRLLVEWKFNKKALQFDDDTMILTVEKKPVVLVHAHEGHLKLEWLDDKWGSWEQLLNATEYKELVENANVALKIAQELRAKGKGKGKPE